MGSIPFTRSTSLQLVDSIELIDLFAPRYSTLLRRCAVQKLFRRPSGVYVFPPTVPLHLRSIVGKREGLNTAGGPGFDT